MIKKKKPFDQIHCQYVFNLVNITGPKITQTTYSKHGLT